MKNTLLLGTAALILATLPASADTIYACKDNSDRTVYSQNAGKHCQKTEIGKIGIYSNSPAQSSGQLSNTSTAPQEPPHPQGSQGSQEDQAKLKAAQQELDAAKKALAEGRQIRYGHERNYVRYQERIQKLEDAVQKAQNKLNGLNGASEGHSSARPPQY